MNIISRYIVKEHLGPFFFSLAVIMFVFVTKFIVQYIGRLFGKGLSAITILEFVYLNLAWMLALAVPMSVLVASSAWVRPPVIALPCCSSWPT